MTLILGLASREFAVIVSDRRLTFLRGTKVESRADTENEALVLASQLIMGYTGIARLPSTDSGKPESTAWFAAEVLAKQGSDLSLWLPALAQTTEAALGRINIPLSDKGHAYLGTGWLKNRAGPEHIPGLVLVSNARLATDPINVWRPKPAFTRSMVGLMDEAPGAVLLDAVGATPPVKLFKAYRGKIRYKRRADPTIIVPTIELMINLARETAELDPRVGRDFMVTVMPKSALDDQLVSVQVGGIFDPVPGRLSGYVPEGGDLSSSVAYTPLLITDDGMVMGGGITAFSDKAIDLDNPFPLKAQSPPPRHPAAE